MELHFEKMHGLGNDFIVFEDDGATDYCSIAHELCDRHTGIGADGILVVCKSSVADTHMRIINSDGSEAQMCGNGIRCFAKYVYEHGIVKKDVFDVETMAGIMRPRVFVENGTVKTVEVDMGCADFNCNALPMLCDGSFERQSITVEKTDFTATAVLMGVPHLIVFCDKVELPIVEKYGGLLEQHELFPEKTNVDFVQVLDPHNITVRTWERGCGLTLACGTGSCAAVAACMRAGLVNDREVSVHTVLGKLKIRKAANGHFYMTGAAETVYTARINL